VKPSSATALSALRQHYADVRAYSLELSAPLSVEDQCIQSMPDASPTKWHLGHTTWFFETVLLRTYGLDYQVFHPKFHYLFNSYYEALGPRHARPDRGLLTRPSLSEVHSYREHVDAGVRHLLEAVDEALWSKIETILVLGLQHEQQHQELILTDILHALSRNPLLPAYRESTEQSAPKSEAAPRRWLEHAGGILEVGHAADAPTFAFDNEMPRHAVLLQPFAIADGLVTCGEYMQFIDAGGYRRPEFWLSEGWACVVAQHWRHPLYWLEPDEPLPSDPGAAIGWQQFGLNGVQPLNPLAPVSQLSFFEAAAFAEWAGARLPTEFEWEASATAPGIRQMEGQVWQWTRSSYDPYPGFRPLPGVASEYNGKFMVGQLVLRGSSVATSPGHSRPSYRNFFPPATRWQFSGLRLARDR
jgi:ergothioneine biosynthesis protein EgtB